MDINKQIEEEAREYSNYALAQDGYIKGYNACLHSSRWRKVSDEMPQIDKQVLLITIYDDNPTIGCLHNDDGELYISSESSEYELNDIMSWKPID